MDRLAAGRRQTATPTAPEEWISEPYIIVYGRPVTKGVDDARRPSYNDILAHSSIRKGFKPYLLSPGNIAIQALHKTLSLLVRKIHYLRDHRRAGQGLAWLCPRFPRTDSSFSSSWGSPSATMLSAPAHSASCTFLSIRDTSLPSEILGTPVISDRKGTTSSRWASEDLCMA